MHKTYIKLLSTLTIIILLIFISACVKGSNPKVLRIGVSGQMPPYSYYDEKNNKLVGFDIDIANE
ncbi:MAG: transporter substrate-binding domain-containing protein, partial [Cyanobacteriota bacterium]